MKKTPLYAGPVAFVNGVHYPATVEDDQGRLHADLTRPLRWTPDGYRPAEDNEPLHNDVHRQRDLELDPGGED